MVDDPYYHTSCPQCDAPREIPWDQLGHRIVCNRCGEPYVADPGPPPPYSGQAMTPPRKTWSRALVTGVGGLACLATAAALWYVSIQLPLEEMRRHVPRVHYSLQRIAFIPFFAGAGAVLILMSLLSPVFANRASGPSAVKRTRVLGVVGLVLSMVPGWFLYSWFEGEMKKEGYDRGLLGAQPRTVPVPRMEIPALSARPDTEHLNAQLKEMNDRVRKIQDGVRQEHTQGR